MSAKPTAGPFGVDGLSVYGKDGTTVADCGTMSDDDEARANAKAIANALNSDPSREAMREALQAVLRFAERNHCTHEETRRLGAIWTECTGCGRKWADDEGGMPECREPDEFIAARAALALDGGKG